MASCATDAAKTPIAEAVAQLDDIEAALDDLNVRVTNNGGKPTPASALPISRQRVVAVSHVRLCCGCVAVVDELKVHDAALTGISVNLDNIKSRERAIRFERCGRGCCVHLPALCEVAGA